MTGDDFHRRALARRLRAQLLRGSSVSRPEEVVGHLLAVQAQEHRYARWSIAQRMRQPVSAEVVDEAFDQGRFLRTHVLRPTWHYAAAGDLRWLMRLSGPRVQAGNVTRYRQLELDPQTLTRTNDLIAAAVSEGPKDRFELARVIEDRGISVDGQRLIHMLMNAELDSVVCSGPMKGRQQTYAAFDEKVPATAGPEGEDALAELARRYLTTRGPATLKDFAWWSGFAAADARLAVESVKHEFDSTTVDGQVYWFAESSDGQKQAHRVDLVQCYDEIIIAYTQSRSLLGTSEVDFPVPGFWHGYTHPVLLDGKLVGHWRVEKTTEISTRIVRTLTDLESEAVSRAVEGYQRFATPIDS